jgi:hypothetical protein
VNRGANPRTRWNWWTLLQKKLRIGATLPLYHWIERGGLELMPLGREELVAAIDWIERYADRPMDLADASLVVAALKTGCAKVWTLDRGDFETYRLPGRKHFTLV